MGGHASQEGPTDHNEALSLRRASDDPRFLRTQAMLLAAAGDFAAAAALLQGAAGDGWRAADAAAYARSELPQALFSDDPSLLAPDP